MNASRFYSLFLVGLSLGFAACGGDSLTLPSEGEAAAITVKAGDTQSGRVGTQLAIPLIVEVTDTKGRPVGNATVAFQFPSGTAAPDTSVTDANGQATSVITLGTQTGTVTGVAQVQVPTGTVPVQTSFTATALPADANVLTLVSGDNQQGPVGTDLPQPLVVAVTDGFGNPIAGVNIDWTVDGGGTASAASTPTDGNGQASVTRTLGPTAGTQHTIATSAGLAGSPVTFTHTANAGSASRIVKVSGDNQTALTGTELPQPLVVQVFDASNNPIANRPVAWLPGVGDGSVNPTTSNTDTQGLTSTRWTLGASGNNTVNAVVSGVGTVTFTATASAGAPSPTRSKVAAAPDNFAAGGSSSITVTVRDGNGNRIAGITVNPSSSGTGNSFSPASAATDDNGVATFSFSSTVAEKKTITVETGGVTLQDTPVITVFQRTSTTHVTGIAPEPSTAGQSIHVTWTVTGQGGGTPTGTMTVFSLQEATGGQCSNVPVSQGACDIILNNPGTHTIGASYSGDAEFQESGDQQQHVVAPVTPTDQPPVAGDDAYTTAGVNQLLTVAAPGVLANDTDPDPGAVLTAGNASTPTAVGGSVSLSSDGSFTYTPPADATGTDTFTYTVSDGELSATATVTITIP